MNAPPPLQPLLRDQRKVDAEHLKLLAVFHYVLGGLAVVGLGFLFMHWLLMNTFMGNPEMWQQQGGKGPPPPPKEFFAIFKWFYLFIGTMIVVSGVANVVSGLSIRARRWRVFSLIVAGINCLCFPFGTVLGVFTFVVLLRESVAEAYEAAGKPAG
jgi:hypothetical protein